MSKFTRFLGPIADGRILICIAIIFAAIFADQITKTHLISFLKTRPGYFQEVTSFLDFVYAWNYGASFGFLRDYYQYSNYLFLTVNCIIVFVLMYILLRSSDLLSSISFALIIGGALGNILDRVARGAVFDFIYFHYGEFSFPAFNLADSFITIGAGIYFIHHYYKHRRSINSSKDSGSE